MQSETGSQTKVHPPPTHENVQLAPLSHVISHPLPVQDASQELPLWHNIVQSPSVQLKSQLLPMTQVCMGPPVSPPLPVPPSPPSALEVS